MLKNINYKIKYNQNTHILGFELNDKDLNLHVEKCELDISIVRVYDDVDILKTYKISGYIDKQKINCSIKKELEDGLYLIMQLKCDEFNICYGSDRDTDNRLASFLYKEKK